MKPFELRPIQFLRIQDHEGWSLKLYSIAFDAPLVDERDFASGVNLALESLPQPAMSAERAGVGFCVLHHGRGADYIVLGWWDRENEMPVRVFVCPVDEGEWRAARGGESFCVWDLQVIAFERDAYVGTILAQPPGNVQAYLDSVLCVPAEGRTLWFDRLFDLGLPASAFAGLLDRLRAAPDRLENLVGGLAQEVVTVRSDGAWSVQENVGHFIDLEPLWDGRLDDFVANRSELRAADLENRRTHEAVHNEDDMADLLAKFRIIRLAMVDRLEAQGPEFLSRVSLHPRLKQPMSPTDLMFFVAEHDDHHFVTIAELVRRLSP